MKKSSYDLDYVLSRNRRRVPVRACVKRPIKTKAQYIREAREAEKIASGFDDTEKF